jgi:putative peptide zinc metalloprotease protein
VTVVPAPAVDQPRYRLAPETRLARQQGSGRPLASLGQSRVFRLGDDIGTLLETVADAATAVGPADLAARLPGSNWDEATIAEALHALAGAGLIHPADVPAPVAEPPERGRPRAARPRLWFDPTTVCRALRGWAGALRGWPGAGLAVIGAAAQIVAWLTGPGLAPAFRLGPILIVVAALVAVAASHELAHGVVLQAAGGRSRAIGLTLVHGCPAFYCDVASAARLDRRGQVEVALAGLVWQCQVGAAAALVVWTGWPLAAATARLWIGLNLATVLFNLLPFLDLDGYLALRAGLDRPDLRRAARAAWRGWLRSPRVGPNRSDGAPLVWFGAFSAIGPALLPLPAAAWLSGTIWPGRSVLGLALVGAGALLWGVAGWRRARRDPSPVET